MHSRVILCQQPGVGPRAKWIASRRRRRECTRTLGRRRRRRRPGTREVGWHNPGPRRPRRPVHKKHAPVELRDAIHCDTPLPSVLHEPERRHGAVRAVVLVHVRGHIALERRKRPVERHHDAPRDVFKHLRTSRCTGAGVVLRATPQPRSV